MEKIKKDENRVPIDNPGPDNISGGYLLEFETWLKLDTTDNYFESEITRRHESAYVIQFPKDDDITNDQIAWIENYINRFESTLYSDLLYNDYNKYIDFPSWVDYILINEALKNNDVFHSSTYLHKKKDGKLFAGPVWDFNLAMGNVNWGDSYLTEGWLMEKRYLVSRLYQDSIFVNEFNKRWNSLRKDLLATHTIKSLINDYKNLLDKAQKNNYVRWPILGKYIWPNRYVGYSYEDEINYLEHWIQARFSWIDSQFSDIPYSGELQITGDVYKLFHNSTQEYSGSLKGGKKDKLWIEFYEINPKNFYDIPNKDGREGEFKKYWYKPQKKKEGYYKDGELISEKCWDVDGNEMNCNDLEF
jgi:hypothetical protein